MAKQTQMEKAIAGVDADIAILQATRARLVKQDEEQKAKKRKPQPISAEPWEDDGPGETASTVLS